MRFLKVLCLIILYAGPAQAQENLKEIAELSDSVPDINFFMISFDYSTNTNIPGNINRDIRQPSLSPSVAFVSKFGLDALIAGNFTDNSDDSLHSFSNE
ncbi:MAG TPA: hypothetical protein VHI78_06800, partial [Bacteroidales bacterium]|nr:hypothetical protein [Bacteroidales bacterium]